MSRISLKTGIFILLLAPGYACSQSIYDENSYQALVSDHRARQAGDLLTILIFETASSATSADTDMNKSLDLSITARSDSDRNLAELGISNGSKGGGNITRAGRLMASVSVTVDSITANGELLVKGGQSIEFNDEHQYITVEGRVREQDISNANTVLSTNLADAKITYVGDGLLGSRQKPGFIRHFFNWLF